MKQLRKLHISLKQKNFCDKQINKCQINSDNRKFVDVKCCSNTKILQLKSNSQYKSPPFHISLEDFSIFICKTILFAFTEYDY